MPDSAPPLPIDAPSRRRLPVLLRQAWFRLNQAFRRRIAHLGLTPDQFTTLRTLLEAGEITQRELTRLMSSDPNTVASFVERMERAGLIARRTNEKDRRAYSLAVLPAGRRVYQQAREVALSLQGEVLHCLSAAEREQFLECLARVGESCGRAAEASPPRRPATRRVAAARTIP